MPKSFRVAATHRETGERREFAGHFSDEEWERLTLFRDCASPLLSCRFATSYRELRYSISGGQDRSLTVETSFPPEDDIAAFLHWMRPFLLKSESTYFFHIVNLLAKRVELDAFRTHLDALRDQFRGEHLAYHIEIGIGAKTTRLTSEDAVMTWLNAFEYHRIPDKRREISALFQVFPEPGTRAVFLTVLISAAHAIETVCRHIDGFANPQATVGAG